MAPVVERSIDDPLLLAYERRAKGLDDGSQDPERDARADAEAQKLGGIVEEYEAAVRDGRIVILPKFGDVRAEY